MNDGDRYRRLPSLAALAAFALLASGCVEGAEPDPWQLTPLSEAASRCDRAKVREHLDVLRRHRLAPNLRDLHHPEGALARWIELCANSPFNPAVAGPDVDVVRSMLEVAGSAATPDAVRGYLTFARLDRIQIHLPATRSRTAVPPGAAIVSVDPSGMIRVSSGEELSVLVPGPEDVLSFAFSIVARAAGEIGAPDLPPGGGAALRIDIGPGDELRVARRPTPLRRDDLELVLNELLPGGPARVGRQVVLEADPAASYGAVVEVLDALAGAGSGDEVVARLERGIDLVFETGAGGDPPAVAIKVDRSAAFSALTRILDALARAGIEHVILLSSLDLQGMVEEPPSSDPGGLPGGLHLRLVGRRAEPPASPRSVPSERPPAVVELPSTDVVFHVPEVEAAERRPGEPLLVGGEVIAPVKLHAPAPSYTEIARKARIQGVVIVQAVIDERGDVVDVKVLKGLPMGLDAQAVEAIRQWKFKPATLDGEPAAVYYNLTVSFRLE